uniref:BTB domain-containing protein n=1 Tax=Panagrellus redivivus TaxID=6233 RepID=A0A7E4ZRM2_PANRE
MSTVQEIVTRKDSTTITLMETDLTTKSSGEFLSSPMFDVPDSDGLKWWIRLYPLYPAGDADTENCGIFLFVNKSVKSTSKCIIDGSSIRMAFAHEFTDPPIGYGRPKFASHEQLRPLFQHGQLTVTCSVEFYIPVKRDLSVPRNFQLFGHVPTDVELVVESDRVQAHKSFLSLISPVFHAMFSNDTAESKSNTVELVEFHFDTVKSAVDFAYRRELMDLSVETAVDMLRFCDKYFITAAIEELEKLTVLIPSIENICQVVHYAYDCNRDSLLDKCCDFFKDHQDEIKVSTDFAELPPTLVVDILKKAFDLNTSFDVLYYAHENGINFVVDHLEEPLIKSMSVDNFCQVVKFAWEYSRKDLQQACATYLNDNREEVTDLEDFINLPYEVMQGVLKMSHVLKRSTI